MVVNIGSDQYNDRHLDCRTEGSSFSRDYQYNRRGSLTLATEENTSEAL